MQTWTRAGLTFDVTETGPADGEPVVLLHGFPQNRHSWSGVTPRLVSAGHRVLAPDQRGYSPGARPRGRRAYAVAEVVDDLIALLDSAGIERAHLVGHDWGAMTAWATASRYPERVRTLTAVSVPHPAAFAWAVPRGQALKSWYMGFFQLPVLPERLLTTSRVVRTLAHPGLTEQQMRGYLDALGPAGVSAALGWYRAMPVARPGHEYGHRTSVPTLFVWGDRDPAITRVAAEATGRYVTGPYRFEPLEGVGHWIPDVEPERLAGLVLERIGG